MSAATELAALVALLERATERRLAFGLPSAETNAFRLCAGEVDDLPGFTVDAYADYRVLGVYRDEPLRERLLAEACMTLGARGVYVKRRPRQANTLSEAERSTRAPSSPVLGESAPDSLPVLENGVRFAVRLGDGLSTGIFLDQRLNRRRLLEQAQGQSVLNLFAYTCAFGVVAAAGGASQTVNVDVAKNVLERGRENYALNQLDPAQHLFLARDALEAVPRLQKQGRTFSQIVLDPPSYASTKRSRFRLEDALAGLVEQCLKLLEPGGALLVCANQAGLTAAAFRGLLAEGQGLSGRPARLEVLACPPEHVGDMRDGTVLRSAWLTLT